MTNRICFVGVTVERLFRLKNLIGDLLKFNFDKIYLCIPKVSRCGGNFLGISEVKLPENVEVIRGEDYGGVTPIVYSSMVETSGTIYIVNDSMTIYNVPFHELEESLKEDNVTGLFGVCTSIFPLNFQFIGINRSDKVVDWISLDGIVCFKSGQFDTRHLARYRPELIEYPDLRFSLWLESMKIYRVSIGLNATSYVRSTSNQLDFRKLKKALGMRYRGYFNNSQFKFFFVSLGFLLFMTFVFAFLMIWLFSLRFFLFFGILIALMWTLFFKFILI